MDTQIIVTAILGFSGGILVGSVLACSRSRESYRLIQELKEWAEDHFIADPDGYRRAQTDVRARIEAYEEEQ